MKATINVNTLRNAIAKLQGIIDKRNTRPILANTLFKFKTNSLELLATDLEVSLKVISPVTSDFEYSFCLNTKSLFEILRELPDDVLEIKINKDNNIIELNCREIHFTLLITNSEEYPQLVFPERNNSFDISTNIFSELISRTSYSISNDETRLFLNGLYFQTIEGRLRVVSTDGHRLALIDSIDIDESIEELVNGVIIPKKGIFELKKIIETTDHLNIKLSFDETFLYVHIDSNIHLSIRLISREFPKYQTVIPNDTKYKLVLDTKEFLNAVKRIKIMSSDKSNAVKLILDNDNVTIEANHPTLGKASETINGNFNGDKMEIGFNAKYLLDALLTFDTNEVNLELINEMKPIIINSDEISNYLSIIMPLKI